MEAVVGYVTAELVKAFEKYGPMASAHEGYAVLLEEVRELEKEVFRKQGRRDLQKMANEAYQVAAMAIRFVVDMEGWTE